MIREDLSAEQQQELTESIRKILEGVEASDAVALIALVGSNDALRSRVTQEMTSFASRQLNMHVATSQ